MNPLVLWPYFYRKKSRHGRLMLYVRVPGADSIRLYPPEGVTAEEFDGNPDYAPLLAMAYSEAVAEAKAQRTGAARARGSIGSFDWLVSLYIASATFQALAPPTQRRRQSLLEGIAEERPAPTPANARPAAIGATELHRLTRKFWRGMMGRWRAPKPGHANARARAGGVEAANNRLRAIRALYKWAAEDEHVEYNPARDVPLLASGSHGFHSWTTEEIKRFLAHWGPGTWPRVALFVLLCTGARRSDAYHLGEAKVSTIEMEAPGGKTIEQRVVSFVPYKTRKAKRPPTVTIPVLRILDAVLAQGPSGDDIWIVGDRGSPFASAASFGNSFSAAATAAGLPHCAAHGLRKGGAAMLAELGLTPYQLNAIYGWTGMEMSTVYTAAADRARQGTAIAVLDDALATSLALDLALMPGAETAVPAAGEDEDEEDD